MLTRLAAGEASRDAQIEAALLGSALVGWIWMQIFGVRSSNVDIAKSLTEICYLLLIVGASRVQDRAQQTFENANHHFRLLDHGQGGRAATPVRLFGQLYGAHRKHEAAYDQADGPQDEGLGQVLLQLHHHNHLVALLAPSRLLGVSRKLAVTYSR